MLETGDIGGDYFGGLPCHVGEPWQADVLCGSTSAGCRVRHRRIGGVPRQADVLETGDIGGDKLSGLEIAGFSG